MRRGGDKVKKKDAVSQKLITEKADECAKLFEYAFGLDSKTTTRSVVDDVDDIFRSLEDDINDVCPNCYSKDEAAYMAARAGEHAVDYLVAVQARNAAPSNYSDVEDCLVKAVDLALSTLD